MPANRMNHDELFYTVMAPNEGLLAARADRN
jgi:hypothetical protein